MRIQLSRNYLFENMLSNKYYLEKSKLLEYIFQKLCSEKNIFNKLTL